MSIKLQPDPLPLRLDEKGAIRVGDSRITLDVLLDDYKQGLSPEQIAGLYDTITLADIYAAITYYLRHKEEVDEYIRQREEKAQTLRQEMETAQQPFLDEMKARIQALRNQRNGHASPAE